MVSGAGNPLGGGSGCRICVSVARGRFEALPAAIAAAAAADLVEVRLDALEDPDACDGDALAGLVKASPVPVGFTCRPVWQGGGYRGGEADRRALLERAGISGAAFVDVEAEADWAVEFLSSCPAPVLLSHHWQQVRPRDVSRRAGSMLQLRPAVVKLVAPAATAADALPLLRAGARLVQQGQAATAFCVGETGRASRLLVAAYGGALTYAAAEGGQEVAEGQWPLSFLREEIRLGRWRRGFRCCGLLGHPVGHSLSPRIFNAAFAAAGQPLGYLPVASASLEPALKLADGWGFQGLSVTMPFKEEAAAACATLSPEARTIGAVNTLVATSGGWAGHNTDAPGVLEAIRSVLPVAERRVAVVGAGGAARAATVALAGAGARVAVLNRTPERAAAVAALVGGESGPLEELRRGAFDVVVHATPVGMAGGEAPSATAFPVEWLRGTELVFDLVYRPRTTPLLQQASARGCKVLDGLEMFVRQAAAQYRLWAGTEPPVGVLRRAAEEALEGG